MNQIKVSTYTIQVRERNTVKKQNIYINFSDVKDNDDKSYDFKELFKEFIKQFDKEFIGLRSGNKAMRLSDDITFQSTKNIISGFFKAGSTGEQKEIFERDINGTEESVFTVKSNHVNCSDYYFILWLPKDSATGILMVQGTSVESAGDLFKNLLHIFLADKLEGKTVKVSRYTSNKTIEEFKSNSKVQRIVLTKNSYPKDKANDILGQEILNSNVRLKIVIEGNFMNDVVLAKINDTAGISLGNQPKFFTSETLEDLEFGKEDDYNTDIAFKETEGTKSATAKSKSGFQIKPYTYLNESLIVRDRITNIPTRKSLKKAIDDYFSKIQDELK